MPKEKFGVEGREVEAARRLVDQAHPVGARVVAQLIVEPRHRLLDRRFTSGHALHLQVAGSVARGLSESIRGGDSARPSRRIGRFDLSATLLIMKLAAAWLVTVLVTVVSLILDFYSIAPTMPWSALALFGFIAFAALSYRQIAELQRQLDARPWISLSIVDNEQHNQIVPLSVHEKDTRKTIEMYPAFFKMLTVRVTSHVTDCAVRLDDLRQDGKTCVGFVPTNLRWHGREGTDCDYNSFSGKDRVLFLKRRPSSPDWEIQTPVAEGPGSQFRYPPGDYAVDVIVSGHGAANQVRFTGLLRVGQEQTDVSLTATTKSVSSSVG